MDISAWWFHELLLEAKLSNFPYISPIGFRWSSSSTLAPWDIVDEAVEAIEV